MAQVGCAGILVSDTFCGPMIELPREGQLLAVDSLPTKAGGCAANVAIGLSKQGISVDIAGCLGKDPSSRVLLASLAEHRVGCQHIVYSEKLPTSKTIILLVKEQDRRYIHAFGANQEFSVAQIDRGWVRDLKVLYVGGLFLMPSFHLDEFIGLLDFCRAHGVQTVVDVVIPQNTPLSDDLSPLLERVDYFIPNEDEAALLTGLTDPMEQLRAFLSKGANTVFITLGRKGVLAGRGHRSWQAGTFAMEVVDPSGSGDAFGAGVVMGALRGWDIPDTLRSACALGASAIRAIGTTDGVFTAPEVEAFLSRHALDIKEAEIDW